MQLNRLTRSWLAPAALTLLAPSALAQSVEVSSSTAGTFTFSDMPAAMNFLAVRSGVWNVELDPFTSSGNPATYTSFVFHHLGAGGTGPQGINISIRPSVDTVEAVRIVGNASTINGISTSDTQVFLERIHFDGDPGVGPGGLRIDTAACDLNRCIVSDTFGQPGVRVVGNGSPQSTIFSMEESVIRNCENDSTTTSFGGGILAERGVLISVTESLIQGCRAWRGAGLYVEDAVLGTNSIVLDGARLESNRADTIGGGIHAQPFNSLSIQNSLFQSNRTENFGGLGGGIYCVSPASMQLQSSVFLLNSTGLDGAAQGGGMYLEDVNSSTAGVQATLNVDNCLFARNTGAEGGAARLIDASVAFNNCTFAENSAFQGSAVSTSGSQFPALSLCAVDDLGPASTVLDGPISTSSSVGVGVNGVNPNLVAGRGEPFVGFPGEGENTVVYVAGDYYLDPASTAVDIQAVSCPTSFLEVPYCDRTAVVTEALDGFLRDAGFHYRTPRIGVHTIFSDTAGTETANARLGTAIELTYRSGPPTPNHLPGWDRTGIVVFSQTLGSQNFGTLTLPIILPPNFAPNILWSGVISEPEGIGTFAINAPANPALVGLTIHLTGATIEVWQGPNLIPVGPGSTSTLVDPNLLSLTLGL